MPGWKTTRTTWASSKRETLPFLSHNVLSSPGTPLQYEIPDIYTPCPHSLTTRPPALRPNPPRSVPIVTQPTNSTLNTSRRMPRWQGVSRSLVIPTRTTGSTLHRPRRMNPREPSTASWTPTQVPGRTPRERPTGPVQKRTPGRGAAGVTGGGEPRRDSRSGGAAPGRLRRLPLESRLETLPGKMRHPTRGHHLTQSHHPTQRSSAAGTTDG